MSQEDRAALPQQVMAGQVVVVTGSTRGIGRAVALGFGELGASIVINGRSPRRLAAAVKVAKRLGIRCLGVRADVASPSGARQLLDRAFKVFGRVDMLVNNAGVSGPPPAPFWQLRPAAWADTLKVNLTGVLLCSAAYVRQLIQQGLTGRILNVSSTAGTRGYPGLAPYCASKFGVRGLTECQALDLEGTGITVTCLELAGHHTPMTRRRLAPEDYEGLAPPEEAINLFVYAATGPPELLQGRTLSELRFRVDQEAEVRLNGPLAAIPPWLPHMPRYITEPAPPPGSLHLDFLENPNGPPVLAHEALKQIEAPALADYPDPRLTSLRRALAEKLELPPECFTFGNGSTELVERVLRTFTRPGDEAVATDPTWPVFERFCRAHGVGLVRAPYTIDRSYQIARLDLQDVLAAVNPRTRLIYLVSPSNPLGAAITEAEFLDFLQRLRPGLPVVVDEAYIEYSERPDVLRTNRLVLQTARPLIGLRTFSKFFGLAGMRLGYAFGAPETVRLIARLHLPFATSAAAEIAALAALQDFSHAEHTRAVVRRGREQLRAGLAKLGLLALSSEANFLMAEMPAPDPGLVYDTLMESGIFLPEVVWNGFMQLPIWDEAAHDRYLQVLARLRRPQDV